MGVTSEAIDQASFPSSYGDLPDPLRVYHVDGSSTVLAGIIDSPNSLVEQHVVCLDEMLSTGFHVEDLLGAERPVEPISSKKGVLFEGYSLPGLRETERQLRSLVDKLKAERSRIERNIGLCSWRKEDDSPLRSMMRSVTRRKKTAEEYLEKVTDRLKELDPTKVQA